MNMIWRTNPKLFLRGLFQAALEAADPMVQVGKHLPPYPGGKVIVVGAGKASAKMARAVELHWPGADISGLVVTRHGHAVPCEKIEIVEAAHPVPDAAGEGAARRILEMVSGLTPNDLVVALISGGGSALLALPAPGLSLADKQSINADLLKSGATIAEINCVRKHLSAVKGGRLAAAIAPAKVLTLLISDVPGDDPAVIASGPAFGEITTAEQALATLRRYAVDVPEHIERHLRSQNAVCLRPEDGRLSRAEWKMIATPAMALEAAASRAREAGVAVVVLGDDLEGDAAALGKEHAELVDRNDGARPLVFISGGETSVKVKGHGRGGRNVEYLLSLCLHLNANRCVYAIAADTDGIDGIEEVAGALIGPDSLERAAALGMDAGEYLARNDAHTFFEKLGDQIITGPTLTNVNDFRSILVL